MPARVIIALLVALFIPIPVYAQDVNSRLIEAAKNGQTEKVKTLLEAGAKVNAKNKNGLTALIGAAGGGRTETAQLLLARGGAVGRMSLTNYLLHTVIHVAIFFGVGLGLYGKVSPVAGVGVTFLMYASMIFLSVWWMGRFRFGPAEWLWRTLTYGKFQPMRLRRASET